MPGILQRLRRRRLVSNANLGHTIHYCNRCAAVQCSTIGGGFDTTTTRLCRDLLCVADESSSRLTQLLNGNNFVLQMSYITRSSVQSRPYKPNRLINWLAVELVGQSQEITIDFLSNISVRLKKF